MEAITFIIRCSNCTAPTNKTREHIMSNKLALQVRSLDSITRRIRELTAKKKRLVDDLSAFLPLSQTVTVGKFRVRYTMPTTKYIPLTDIRQQMPRIYDMYVKETVGSRIELKPVGL